MSRIRLKETLLTIAVAGALAAPASAFAQAKPPERAAGLEPIGGAAKNELLIFGRANLGIDNWSATGATAGSRADYKSRTRVYDAASRLGVRGTELLGNGLKATFNIESGVNMDTGSQLSQSGATNISTGVLASRIANVSLVFPQAGQISFGRTNVWWSNGTIEQTGANYINTGVSTASGTYGRGMGVGISRVSNLFQYITPVFAGGTYASFSYSPTSEASPAGGNTDGKLLAVSVEGATGVFQWGVDLAKSTASTLGSAGIAAAVPAQVNVGGSGVTVPGLAVGSHAGVQHASTGQKLRFGWWYTPGGKIAVIWNKSIQDYGGAFGGLASNPDPTASKLTQSAWTLSWEHRFGNVQGLAQFGKLANVQGCVTAGACDNTNATQWLVGMRYIFSPRTWLYASYNASRNASNYNIDYVPGGISSATAGGTTLSGAGGLPVSSVGADPRVFALGLQHRF